MLVDNGVNIFSYSSMWLIFTGQRERRFQVYPFYFTLRAGWGQYWDGFTQFIILTPLLWVAVYLCPLLLPQPHGIWAKHSDLFSHQEAQLTAPAKVSAHSQYQLLDTRGKTSPSDFGPPNQPGPPNCQVTPNLRGLNLPTWGSRSHGAKFHEQHRTVVLCP